jgi:hypothetical protein
MKTEGFGSFGPSHNFRPDAARAGAVSLEPKRALKMR